MKQLIILFCIIINFLGLAQKRSPFNQLPIAIDSTGNYKFMVSGHFYGGQCNQTGFPTNTLLANLDTINQSNSNFIICLGDLFADVKNNIPKYQRSLFTKMTSPLFNAVGNHDLSGNVYQDHFGATYFYFIINNDIHLILDTETDNGSIKGEQLKLLNEIKNLTQTNSINNVFIYAHRTLWARSYPDLNHLFKDNTQAKFGNNFKSDILPILKSISKTTNLYWFSGSLGEAPASFFYFKDNNINYIATAIRGLPRDAVLFVNVKQGEVSFETKSLTDQEVLPLYNYDVDYWDKTPVDSGFNYRLLPLYTKQMLFHPFFWIGIGLMFFIFTLYLITKKKRENSNSK